MSTFSLRRHFTILLLTATTLAWSVMATFSYFDARREIGEVMDAQLAQSARIFLLEATHELDEIAEREINLDSDFDGEMHHKYEHEIAFQIWDLQGKLLLRSASAPPTYMSKEVEGYSDSFIDQSMWRVFSRHDVSGNYLVQVGERHEIRNALAREITLHLLMPLLLALPVLAILIWIVIGRGIRPLTRVADEVANRAPQHLEPLETHTVPQEIMPLVNSLNVLFARLQQAFEHERRFTADAAHELRTPLAALKTQAQVALNASIPEQQHNALLNVVTGVDRATHLVEQMLTLARLEPRTFLESHKNNISAVEIQYADIQNLHKLAAYSLAEIAQTAFEKNIELSLDEMAEGSTAQVMGNADMLGILLRNLIDNAIRYTPPNGDVKVHIHTDNQQVSLQVSDTGVGIPQAERTRVLERFYRVLGNQESGSGLGLSIVMRIAELHGATVSLDDAENNRGLKVTVRFPAVAAVL